MSLLEFLLVVILIGWFGGFAFNIAGNAIHFLLFLALIVFIFDRYSRPRV